MRLCSSEDDMGEKKNPMLYLQIGYNIMFLSFLYLTMWSDLASLSPGFLEEESPYGDQGNKGTYYYEFSRPLRTMDRFQQVNLWTTLS